MLGIDPRHEDEFKSHSQEQETALYDQPELEVFGLDDEIGAETVAAELRGMRIKKPSRKKRKREKSLRDIAANLPQPQYIMRDEILGNRHHVETGLTPAGQFDAKVPELTEDITLQYELSLPLAQWKVVRKMVEDGLRLGYAAGQADPR